MVDGIFIVEISTPSCKPAKNGGIQKLKPDLASVIKVGAVLTAAPRWVGALLAAEGFLLPAEWLGWWIPVSAVLSACMALVEGLAFAYIYEAWRNQTDNNSPRLFLLSMVSAVFFVIILAPYIAAQVSGVPLRDGLTGVWLYAWSVAVGASTISIVAGVGYAQKRRIMRALPKIEVIAPAHDAEPMRALVAHTCASCGEVCGSQQKLAAHMRWQHAPEKVNGRVK